jgi:hypothetical protein
MNLQDSPHSQSTVSWKVASELKKENYINFYSIYLKCGVAFGLAFVPKETILC